jgi:hypothetical protein
MLSRSRAIAAAAAISLFFVAGCGASGDDETQSTTTTTTAVGGSTTTTTAEKPSGDNGVADLSAEEILDEATTALRDAGSVQVTGSINDDGSKLDLDLGLSRTGAAGTLEIDGNKVELVVTDDTVYMQGDEDFYRSIGGASAAKLLGDRWLSVGVDSAEGKKFSAFGDFDGFVDSVLDPGEVAKGETGDVEGTPAIALDDADSDAEEPGQLWVATEGEPYPLQVNKKGSDTEKITFTRHGEAVDVTPPPADDILDLDDLRGRGNGNGNGPTTTEG